MRNNPILAFCVFVASLRRNAEFRPQRQHRRYRTSSSLLSSSPSATVEAAAAAAAAMCSEKTA